MAPYVALFGYYKYGNFGDDLMATMFALELRSRDIPFVVYGLNQGIVDGFHFQATDSIEELLSNANAVVYGGGGAFLPERIEQFDAAIQQLCEICSANRIPIYMCSVGGDGTCVDGVSAARRAILELASFVTFRNPEDQALLLHIGHERGAIYNDVVWRTPQYFRLSKVNVTQFTIGVDSTLLKRRKGRLAIGLVKLLCRALRKQYRFLTIVQNGKCAEMHRDLVQYGRSLREFIEGILQADLVITNRLHLGMAAMSYDIPVIALFPVPKSGILFRRLGLEHMMVTSLGHLSRLFSIVWDRKSVDRLRPSGGIRGMDRIVRDSGKHFESLLHILELQNDMRIRPDPSCATACIEDGE